MKLVGEVLACETVGDALRVTLQMAPPGSPDWFGLKRQEVVMRDHNNNARTYHVGRRVQIEVKPL